MFRWGSLRKHMRWIARRWTCSRIQRSARCTARMSRGTPPRIRWSSTPQTRNFDTRCMRWLRWREKMCRRDIVSALRLCSSIRRCMRTPVRSARSNHWGTWPCIHPPARIRADRWNSSRSHWCNARRCRPRRYRSSMCRCATHQSNRSRMRTS